MDRFFNINPPKDLRKYILEHADERYLIYDKKIGKGYCSCCEKEFDIKKPELIKHGGKGHCPKCKEAATFKSVNKGRKNLTEYGRVLWFKAKKETTYAELGEYIIDYRGITPNISYFTAEQYKFSKAEQAHYKHIPACYWSEDRWEKIKKMSLPNPAGTCLGEPKFSKTIIYEKIKLGTDLKYANTNNKTPYELIGYLSNFLKYQSIEILEKAGFQQIVGQKALGRGCRAINWRGRTLKNILKLTPTEIKEFRQTRGDMRILEIYKEYKKLDIKLKFSDLVNGSLPMYRVTELESITKYVDANKYIKYIRTQGAYWCDYRDYLSDCSKLGLDMRKNKVLFPENLQATHRETSAQVKTQESKRLLENFAKNTSRIYPQGIYEYNRLFIRPATCPSELAAESEQLHHCVRTYSEKVARGECVILFIREKDNPDKSLYTLELSPKGKVIQCRGEYNSSATPEVKEFLDHWERDVLKKGVIKVA